MGITEALQAGVKYTQVLYVVCIDIVNKNGFSHGHRYMLAFT